MMGNETLLSICIPTYNRSEYLCELLDSIVAQDRDDLEVVVSDDASPDDTASAVMRYVGLIKNFKFIRQPANVGLDRNFIAVVGSATGEYIWLMGDDDRLEKGGVDRVIEALKRWPDIDGLTVGVVDYDVTMSQVTGVRTMPPTQRLTGSGEVFSKIADVLGFMSALVIKRQNWIDVAAEPETKYYENYYVQVYIIGRVLGDAGVWGVVQEPCVNFRSGNDQFEVKFGWVRRLEIDVNGYRQIANGLFANNYRARRAMLTRIFNTHVYARVVNARTSEARSSGVLSAAGILIKNYYYIPNLYIKVIPMLFTPKPVLRTARYLYKEHVPSSGLNRAKKLPRYK